MLYLAKRLPNGKFQFTIECPGEFELAGVSREYWTPQACVRAAERIIADAGRSYVIDMTQAA